RLKKATIFCIILALFVAENSRYNKQKNMMQPLGRSDMEIYEILPNKQNRILLEIPYYFGQRAQNASYTLNRNLHGNFHINGTVSIPPNEYIFDLGNILGPHQQNFPSEGKLRRLVNRFSVTHVLFHWKRLEKYSSLPRDEVYARVHRIKNYGKVVFENEDFTLLELKEFVPVKKIARNYASYHLKKYRIRLDLYERPQGNIQIYVNDRLFRTQNMTSESLFINIMDQPLLTSGNRVEIIFGMSVRLKSIELVD
ncbi:hypothetical protein ACFLT9_13370, partial [Acidobacteriota bacterium]